MTIEERLLTVGGMQEIELRVHGLTVEDHGSVPARLFANKMKQLVSALEAADILANGKLAHSYVLAQMHMSQPTAVLSEVLLPEIKQSTLSAVPIFNNVTNEDARIPKQMLESHALASQSSAANGWNDPLHFAKSPPGFTGSMDATSTRTGRGEAPL